MSDVITTNVSLYKCFCGLAKWKYTTTTELEETTDHPVTYRSAINVKLNSPQILYKETVHILSKLELKTKSRWALAANGKTCATKKHVEYVTKLVQHGFQSRLTIRDTKTFEISVHFPVNKHLVEIYHSKAIDIPKTCTEGKSDKILPAVSQHDYLSTPNVQRQIVHSYTSSTPKSIWTCSDKDYAVFNSEYSYNWANNSSVSISLSDLSISDIVCDHETVPMYRTEALILIRRIGKYSTKRKGKTGILKTK